jgi:hypothetical protein
MTIWKAIKWLIAIKEKYIHGGDEKYDEQRETALCLAIVALEKQMPKKVTKSVCPSCNRIFLFKHGETRKGNYCDNCGQALDWSDTE